MSAISSNKFFVIDLISNDDTDIAKKLLEKCPYLAQKKDTDGSLALHCACRRGQFEIAKMLLRMDPDQALQFDNNGYTPLHLAVINGNLAILQEFSSTAPFSFQVLSKNRENVFHLTIRFKKIDAFKFLDGFLKGTGLVYQPDRFGNTIHHLARIVGFHQVFYNNIHVHFHVHIHCVSLIISLSLLLGLLFRSVISF